MTQNQVKEHETIQYYTYDTKSSKGTACSKKEYGCICWRLSNIILMTQNQVKEHETIQYYTYDTKSSKGTACSKKEYGCICW